MTVTIGRREMLAALGGAAAAWPLAARAQQPAMPVIGFLGSASPEGYLPLLAGFRQGLSKTGYIEGQNVAIEYLWAQDRFERLPVLAAELVRRKVAVIFAAGASNSALAAKGATSTLPVVFAMGSDPVRLGLVASMNRPGGNLTGVSFINEQLVQKRIELLHELVPQPALIAMLVNPNNGDADILAAHAHEAARVLGRQIKVLRAGTEPDFDRAFATMTQLRAGALLLAPDPFFNSRSRQLGAQATRNGLPALYSLREFAGGGGLMAYGPNQMESYRQAALYVGRILKGEKPADLPVQQPTKYELTINLKTAKALGIEVPPTLLARADEVIE